MNVIVRPAAEADLDQAFEYYQDERPGLGLEFMAEFRQAVTRILTLPRGWHPLDARHRRCRLRRFPYGVIYFVDDSTSEIVIVAVMNLKRHPDSWRDRE